MYNFKKQLLQKKILT